MTSLDLNRLRTMRSFFVPIERGKLKNAILKVLFEIDKPHYGMETWTVNEHGNSIQFSRNFVHTYVLLEGETHKDSETAEKFKEKFLKMPAAEMLSWINNNIRPNLPEDLYITVLSADEKGCYLEVECVPILYGKISSSKSRDFDEIAVQDANIKCDRFLRIIFIGGLSGTLLSDLKECVTPSETTFLLNDVSDVTKRQITEKVDQMLCNATGDVLIFGYVGTIFLKRLHELKEKGVKIRIITGSVKGIRNDIMRREKEQAFSELISIVGKDQISTNAAFHGRAIIVDNKALVGTMDLDSYSLTGTRIEFAIYTENPEIVRCLRNYFNRIFTPLKEEIEKPTKSE
jgi:hypothetical protein